MLEFEYFFLHLLQRTEIIQIPVLNAFRDFWGVLFIYLKISIIQHVPLQVCNTRDFVSLNIAYSYFLNYILLKFYIKLNIYTSNLLIYRSQFCSQIYRMLLNTVLLSPALVLAMFLLWYRLPSAVHFSPLLICYIAVRCGQLFAPLRCSCMLRLPGCGIWRSTPSFCHVLSTLMSDLGILVGLCDTLGKYCFVSAPFDVLCHSFCHFSLLSLRSSLISELLGILLYAGCCADLAPCLARRSATSLP